jgi:hypothetical protein
MQGLAPYFVPYFSPQPTARNWLQRLYQLAPRGGVRPRGWRGPPDEGRCPSSRTGLPRRRRRQATSSGALRVSHVTTADGLRDLLALHEAAVPPPVVMLPKTESVAEVEIAVRYPGAPRIVALMESGRGLSAADASVRRCAWRRWSRFGGRPWGGNGLASDAVRPQPDRSGCGDRRHRCVRPSVPRYQRFRRVAKGNCGREGIEIFLQARHSTHAIAIVNAVFTPGPDGIAAAPRIVPAFAKETTGWWTRRW